MTQMQMLLQNSRDVQLFALEVMRECDEDFRKFAVIVVETVLNAYMSAEADRACGAGYGERSEERVNSRNGYRERGLETLVGEATLEVPKLRHGSYFPEGVIDRWQRVDRAVAACVVEMYVNGISTRKVRNVAREMGIEHMSKAEVSRICETLDEQVADMRTCDLSAQEYPYLFIDATYVPCRVDHHFVNVAVVVAVGLGMDGRKRTLGVDVVDTENKADWKRFLSDLKARGLGGVRMVVSDDHQGIVAAVAEAMQGVTWQRCVTHLMRNLTESAAGDERQRLIARRALQAALAQKDPELVRACYAEAVDQLAEAGCDRAAAILDDAQTAALNYLSFPVEHAKKIRTSNVIERANREIKRRTDVVRTFPSKESLLRLVGAVLVEENEHWASSPCTISAESMRDIATPDKRGTTTAEVSSANERAREIIADAIARARKEELPKRKGR